MPKTAVWADIGCRYFIAVLTSGCSMRCCNVRTAMPDRNSSLGQMRRVEYEAMVGFRFSAFRMSLNALNSDDGLNGLSSEYGPNSLSVATYCREYLLIVVPPSRAALRRPTSTVLGKFLRREDRRIAPFLL